MNPRRAALALCSLLALPALPACRRSSAATPAHATTSESPSSSRPRLVVVVVLDQVGRNVLERYLPHLRPEGALRRAIARGAFHHRVVYPYAATYTAPGHAAIHTGASPAQSGVVANRVWDPARRRAVSVVDDAAHPVFGDTEASASPSLLRAETVADALKHATGGRGHVVALSLKDRCATIPGGAHPDAALWYDEHARGFTTSSYYAQTMPAWLTEWSARNPVASHFTTWPLLDPAAQYTLGVDEAQGEGNWHGLGTTFPHDLAHAADPYSALLATPQGTDLLLDLADTAAREYHLGDDDVPDLLALSISGTDYVGHVFGSESWEAQDNLVRVDLALGHLLDSLERRGPVAVLITADHGVALRPETSRAAGHTAERLENDALTAVAERAVDTALGPGDWVDAFVQPFLYLSPAGRAPAVRDRAVAAAVEALRGTPGVGGAYDVREVPGFASSDDPVRRAVALSVDPRAGGDVFVVPARDSVVDEHMPEGYGTSHGSPYEYDTEVPVIIAGAGVSHAETTEPLAQGRVAVTVAALLGVPPPDHAHGEPLPGVSARTGL